MMFDRAHKFSSTRQEDIFFGSLNYHFHSTKGSKMFPIYKSKNLLIIAFLLLTVDLLDIDKSNTVGKNSI